MTEEELKKAIEHIFSEEAKEEKKCTLLKQMAGYLNSKFPNTEVTVDGDTFHMAGDSPEDKVQILMYLNEFGVL